MELAEALAIAGLLFAPHAVIMLAAMLRGPR
jgi:hypothetical protein